MPLRWEDLFDDCGLIKGDYCTPKGAGIVKEAQKRAAIKLAPTVREARSNGYDPGIGVTQAMRMPLIHPQLVRRFPWAVIFFDDKGRRKGRRFAFLSEAVLFHYRIHERYPTATVVSRVRGYPIPPKYRGRLPKPWKWCPFCMKPRKYVACLDDKGNRQTFYAGIKTEDGKGGYMMVDRLLLLMECPVCKQRNNHHEFRRSNQKWELIKIPKGKQRYRRKRRS